VTTGSLLLFLPKDRKERTSKPSGNLMYFRGLRPSWKSNSYMASCLVALSFTSTRIYNTYAK
jgi:hypothetical protein